MQSTEKLDDSSLTLTRINRACQSSNSNCYLEETLSKKRTRTEERQVTYFTTRSCLRCTLKNFSYLNNFKFSYPIPDFLYLYFSVSLREYVHKLFCCQRSASLQKLLLRLVRAVIHCSYPTYPRWNQSSHVSTRVHNYTIC